MCYAVLGQIRGNPMFNGPCPHVNIPLSSKHLTSIAHRHWLNNNNSNNSNNISYNNSSSSNNISYNSNSNSNPSQDWHNRQLSLHSLPSL